MAIRWTPVDACLAKLSPFHDEFRSIESNKGIRGSFVPFYDFDKINQNARNAKWFWHIDWGRIINGYSLLFCK